MRLAGFVVGCLMSAFLNTVQVKCGDGVKESIVLFWFAVNSSVKSRNDYFVARSLHWHVAMLSQSKNCATIGKKIRCNLLCCLKRIFNEINNLLFKCLSLLLSHLIA